MHSLCGEIFSLIYLLNGEIAASNSTGNSVCTVVNQILPALADELCRTSSIGRVQLRRLLRLEISGALHCDDRGWSVRCSIPLLVYRLSALPVNSKRPATITPSQWVHAIRVDQIQICEQF